MQQARKPQRPVAETLQKRKKNLPKRYSNTGIIPGITLVWTTQAEMEEWVAVFFADLLQRKRLGSDRPSITSGIELLNMDIDTAVSNVKVYIEKKYRKANAKPQFARFGIVKEYSAYCMPRDNNKRYENLDLMITAIDQEGFGNEEYGT